MTVKTISDSDTTRKIIKISDIHRNGNHRHELAVDEAGLRRMAAEFRDPKIGQLVPVMVAVNDVGLYVLIDGARRIAAAELNGEEWIEADVHSGLDEGRIEAMRTIANLERKDLTPVEEMMAVVALVDRLAATSADRAPAIERAAEYLGRDARWVRDRMVVGRIGERAAMLAVRGYLSIGHLRELAKVGDEKVQADMASRAAGVYRDTPDAATADVRRSSVDELAKWVLAEQRDLKRVPWLLDQEFAGKPACALCPNNTATDGGLFGAAPADGHPGYCMAASCFAAKTRRAEQSIEAVVKRIVKAGDASAETVRAKNKPFLKDATVQRKAKMQIKAAEPAASAEAGAGGGSKNSSAPQKSHETKIADAKSKFNDAKREWADNLFAGALLDSMRADPVRALAWFAIATNNKIIEANADKSIVAHSVAPKPEPEPTRHLRERLELLTAPVDLKSLAAAIHVPKHSEWDDVYDRMFEIFGGASTRALVLIARAMGVTEQQLPDPPKWEDFAPRDKAAHQAAAPDESKTPKRKRTTKKKKGGSKKSEASTGSKAAKAKAGS